MSNCQLLTFQRTQGVLIAHVLASQVTSDWAVHHISNELSRMIWRHRPARVLVNFGRVVTLSSALVRKLQELGDRQRKSGGWLKLCGLSADLREPFRLAATTDTMLDICDDCTMAIHGRRSRTVDSLGKPSYV